MDIILKKTENGFMSTGNANIWVSGFFRLAEACLIKNKVVPLRHGFNKASTCHPSRCAYRQLRCCQF